MTQYEGIYVTVRGDLCHSMEGFMRQYEGIYDTVWLYGRGPMRFVEGQ